MPEYLQPFVYFGLYFIQIFFELIYYSILAWVVLTWIILFGGMKPSNRFFQFFSRVVEPVLRPFRWARLGSVDLSPIVAIIALSYVVHLMQKVLLNLA